MPGEKRPSSGVPGGVSNSGSFSNKPSSSLAARDDRAGIHTHTHTHTHTRTCMYM